MGDMKKRIEGDEGSLQRLMKYIPGFSGYRDRQIRRKADELVRQHLVRLLDGLQSDLEEAIAGWANQGLAHLEGLDTVRTRLGRVRDQIRYADYGYTGWFDAVKIQEDELDAMYDYDLALQGRIEELRQAVEGIATAESSALEPQIEYALSLIRQLAEAVKQREAVTARLVPESRQ